MIRKFFLYFICSLLVTFWAMSMNDARASGITRRIPLAVTGMADAPIGYVQFCSDFPGECANGGTRGHRVVLNDKTFSELDRINRDVNARIEPATDLEMFGVLEYWTLPDVIGDCEDYVLLKRKELIAAGWPSGALLVTVVRDEKNEGHAVLTVATDKGDYILDNQREDIRPWQDTGYSYVKRQSQFDVNRWVYVGTPDTDAVAGVASAR